MSAKIIKFCAFVVFINMGGLSNVFVSSILTLSHTGEYPALPAPWPSTKPYILRDNVTTYSPAGCSINETHKDLYSAFSRVHAQIIASAARREPLDFAISPLAVTIALAVVTSPPVRQQGECSDKMGAQPLIDYLTGYRKTGLIMASGVFVSPKVDLRPGFIETVTKTFRSTLRRLDFEEPTARQEFIERWSKGKAASIVKADTSMAYVNAIRYKGEWLNKFDRVYTYSGGADDAAGNYVVMTLTMVQHGTFLSGYYPRLDADFTELPLKSQDGHKNMSFIFIKPGFVERSEPSYDATHRMANIDITELRSYGNLKDESIFIRKFKVESTINVRSVIESMMPGNSIFDQQTTKLSHVANSPNLIGDQFVQRVSFEINEDGVEALTIDDAADAPAPGSPIVLGYERRAVYGLLVTGDDTPHIVFAARSY